MDHCFADCGAEIFPMSSIDQAAPTKGRTYKVGGALALKSKPAPGIPLCPMKKAW
jgi:hypothetical protein